MFEISVISYKSTILRVHRSVFFVSLRFPDQHIKRNIRELKQQLRRRLLKRHLKSEVAPLQTLSRLFHLVYFVKCWQMFLELNSKGLYQSSGKEKKVVVLCSPPRQNVNSGTFTL